MTKKPFDDSNINNNPYRLHFDPQDYVRYLNGMDLTDTDAEALLATLWDIMVQFVDLGFEVDVRSKEDKIDNQAGWDAALKQHSGRVNKKVGRQPALGTAKGGSVKTKGDGP